MQAKIIKHNHKLLTAKVGVVDCANLEAIEFFLPAVTLINLSYCTRLNSIHLKCPKLQTMIMNEVPFLNWDGKLGEEKYARDFSNIQGKYPLDAKIVFEEYD